MKIDTLAPRVTERPVDDPLLQQIRQKDLDRAAADLGLTEDDRLVADHFGGGIDDAGCRLAPEGEIPPPPVGAENPDIDSAILSFGTKEVAASNRLIGGLLRQMAALNQERRTLAEQIAGLDSKAADYSSRLADLQNQTTTVGTDIAMLQTFLQEAAATKRQAEELTSNLLAQSNRTAENIIQNISR